VSFVIEPADFRSLIWDNRSRVHRINKMEMSIINFTAVIFSHDSSVG